MLGMQSRSRQALGPGVPAGDAPAGSLDASMTEDLKSWKGLARSMEGWREGWELPVRELDRALSRGLPS